MRNLPHSCGRSTCSLKHSGRLRNPNNMTKNALASHLNAAYLHAILGGPKQRVLRQKRANIPDVRTQSPHYTGTLTLRGCMTQQRCSTFCKDQECAAPSTGNETSARLHGHRLRGAVVRVVKRPAGPCFGSRLTYFIPDTWIPCTHKVLVG